ncbi:dephospho-CoA kinase [Nitrosomonas sp. Nm132]|jgi:dephospho-CoA kinase|uniref:dephospho-CoA kinase n=1 Tax=Nitrosomonas sp. Nm132 TaxID=1881053 RepID=UPI0008842B26|nr:dephospho-CoA kinase [Nitrosomonas sp. Nm132]SDG89833.1 dephospho-CoA kinase [Nitrosomonas sp. Nm132]
MPLIIGLTGGIGCGKSSATKFFATYGIDIIDTDEIAHELTLSRGKAMDAIKKTFGMDFIAKDDSLDRNKMRELVFSNPIFRNKLEAILHPLIYHEVIRRVSLATSAYIIVVVPLLLETNVFQKLIHRILVIDCTEQLQISRTIARSKLDEQKVRAIMATQISRKERLEQADDIIVNDRDLDYLYKQVETLHLKYLALSIDKLNKPV